MNRTEWEGLSARISTQHQKDLNPISSSTKYNTKGVHLSAGSNYRQLCLCGLGTQRNTHTPPHRRPKNQKAQFTSLPVCLILLMFAYCQIYEAPYVFNILKKIPGTSYTQTPQNTSLMRQPTGPVCHSLWYQDYPLCQ